MKSYSEFMWILLDTYGYNTDMIWQEQYALWAGGYRGVRLHDITYSIMG